MLWPSLHCESMCCYLNEHSATSSASETYTHSESTIIDWWKIFIHSYITKCKRCLITLMNNNMASYFSILFEVRHKKFINHINQMCLLPYIANYTLLRYCCCVLLPLMPWLGWLKPTATVCSKTKTCCPYCVSMLSSNGACFDILLKKKERRENRI